MSNDSSIEDLKVSVCDGKYTFVHTSTDWRIYVLRHDEPWLVIEAGHRAVYGLMLDLECARDEIEQMESARRDLGARIRDLCGEQSCDDSDEMTIDIVAKAVGPR